MRKLILYCLTDGIQSFAPVLMWVILPLLFGDSKFAEGYILSYPYQFIFIIFYSLLFKSQLKYEKKENKGSGNSYTGLIFLFFVSTLIFVLSVLFYDAIAGVLGFESGRFEVFCFGTGNLVLDWVFMGIMVRNQYNGAAKSAFVQAYVWHLSKLVFIYLLSLFVSSEITLAITLVVYMFVILIWFFRHIDEFGFSVNAFKFSIAPVSYDLGMTVTYLFGINNLSGNGFLAEYNIMSLCTDTQWDVLSTGIDTNTTLNVADGKYDKSLYYIHIVYSVILFVSSALLLVIMCFIPVYHDSLNFGYIWTAFLIEMIWFPLYAIVYTMQGWITMMSPTILQGVLNIFKYVLRTVLTIVIVSEYAVSYAMCVVAVAGNLLYIIMYFYLRRRYKNVSGVT